MTVGRKSARLKKPATVRVKLQSWVAHKLLKGVSVALDVRVVLTDSKTGMSHAVQRKALLKLGKR